MTSTPAVGDIIVVGIVDNDSGVVLYLTDNQAGTGNSYQVGTRSSFATTGSTFIGSGIACAVVNAASGTFTITAHTDSSSTYITLLAVEYSGASCNVDQGPVGAAGGSSPFTCGTFTTTNANDVLVAVIDYNLGSGSASLTASTGFTIQLSQPSSSFQPGFYMDQIVTSTGSFAPQFTGGNVNSSCVSISYKAASSPPSGGQHGYPVVQ
jgi:hypothetical protein